MSEPGPFGGDDPFGGLPFMADFLRMIQSQGPLNWDVTRQIAVSLATAGVSEPNVDPVRRLDLERLGRVAELHVAELVGGPVIATGEAVRISPVTRSVWAQRTLDAFRPLFERLAGSLGAQGAPDVDDAEPFLGPLLKAMTPMLLSFTAGGLVGHLARRSLATYDLPVPRPGTDELLVVVANLDAFGDDWSLPSDDLTLWVCLHDLLHHAVLGRSHVADRVGGLLLEYAGSFQADPDVLEERLDQLQRSGDADLSSLQELLGDPEVVLGAVQSPRQREIAAELAALVAAVGGWVDHQMDRVGIRLIGAYGQVTEALRRRRVEADRSDRFVERLLGLELTQAQYDRGRAFVDGVVERADEEALDRLWSDARHLPTPNEVDAPGLWLARTELDEPDGT